MGSPVSSLNLKAGTSRSEAGVASETRRCLGPVEDEGKGAVNENVEVCVLMAVVIVGGWVYREETGKGMSEEDLERRERTLWTSS